MTVGETASFFSIELGTRRVDYGPVDPVGARSIFIHEALVDRDFDCAHPFFIANGKLLEAGVELETRRRKHDVVQSIERQTAFYEQHIPADVFDAKSLARYIGRASRRERDALVMRPEDLFAGADIAVDNTKRRRSAPDASAAARMVGLDPTHYPDALEVGAASLPLVYRNDPGRDHDGVTVRVPVGLLPRLTSQRLEWLVPGMLPVRVTEMIRSLPGQLRRLVAPAAETAQQAVEALPFGVGDLNQQLARWLSERTGETIRPRDFDASKWAPHLFFRIEVLESNGGVLDAGRDLAQLQKNYAASARASLGVAAGEEWTIDGLGMFPDEPLPESITVGRGAGRMTGWPAIVDRQDSVGVRLHESLESARGAHHDGLRRLFLLQCRAELQAQLDWVPGIDRMKLAFHALRGQQDTDADATSFDASFMLLVVDRAFLQRGSSVPPWEIRSRDVFTSLLDKGWTDLQAASQEAGALVASILDGHAMARAAIDAANLPVLKPMASEAAEHLARLVPRDFMHAFSWERLCHFGRYLAAIPMRLERLRRGQHERDFSRMQHLNAWETAWETRRVKHGVRPGAERLAEFRWWLEEYRVSLFAQELGTALPISDPRLRAEWDAI